MTAPVLELKEVSYRHPVSGRGLDRISLGFRKGERTALLGLNGSGKTTLLLHLNGLLRPESGRVLREGVSMDYGREGLRALRSRVGLVFQNPDAQIFSASVREDVSFGPLNLGLDVPTVTSRVEEALAAVGLGACADRPVQALSHGEKKRLCIAGVLAMKPEVLVLDEPMAGLDPVMQEAFAALLGRLHAGGMTVILATHDIGFARGWADAVHVLAEGHCVASLDAAALKAGGGDAELLALLGKPS